MAYEKRLIENGIPPEPKLIRLCNLSFLQACIHAHLFCIPVDHYALLCLNPVQIIPLYFGHSVAPNACNYVAALVLYGTRGSVAGLNRWEYQCCHCRQSSMSDNIEGGRVRKFFKLTDRRGGVNFMAFVSDAFVALKNASN